MELTGRLIKLLPIIEGESARGHWSRGGLVIETNGEFPRKAAFSVFGQERIDRVYELIEGTEVTVSFNIESREYNEKWYTGLSAYSVIAQNISTPQPQQTPPPSGYAPSMQPTTGQPAYNQQHSTATPRAEYPYAQQAAQQQSPQPPRIMDMEADDQLPFD